jgi:hypothetical protein
MKPIPQPEENSSSRRNLVHETALFICAGAVCDFDVRQGKPSLITLCEEFRILERVSRVLWEHDDPKFWADLLNRQEVLAGKMIIHTPRSLADFQAIARALIGWVPGTAPYEIDDLYGTDGELLSLLLRGLVEAKIS